MCVPLFSLLTNGLLATHQGLAGPYTHPNVGHTPGVPEPVPVSFPVCTNLPFPRMFLTETFVTVAGEPKE